MHRDLEAEDHLRRARELVAELIDQVAALRERLADPWPAPPGPLPPSPEGERVSGPRLAPGELRHAFSAAWRSAAVNRPDPERILPGIRGPDR
jgi:hypothetical protein